MEIVNKAIIFAAKAHDGMRRKQTDIPYILHPVEAASIAATMTHDQEIISASVLHDVVEDTDVSIEDIEKSFGKRVALLVGYESENKRAELSAEETWKIRKQETIDILKNCNDIAVKIICLSDKLSNMRAIHRDYLMIGNEIWQRFNQKDPMEHGWYYKSIADNLTELRESFAYQEYERLLHEVFG